MNIFDALRSDHNKVRELLATLLALDESDTEGRADLVQDIRDELIPHARAEESLFYNSLRALGIAKDQVGHGFREHMETETLLRALQVGEKLNVGWKATAEKLRDALEHHIAEEENEIFAAAAGAFTQEEASQLGEMFIRLKDNVRDEGLMKNTLDMMINTLPPKLSAALRGGPSPLRRSDSQAS